MKGTPGFIGDRLREAREARGLTATALSEIIDVTRQAISLYESGDSSPQPEVMEKIADKLNLPVSFFLREVQINNDNAIFFRARSAATKLDRGRGRSRMKWLYEIIVPYLKQFVKFPEVKIPRINIPQNPLNLSSDDIETIATQVRREWGLGDGPISNVVLLLENNGFIITRINLESPTLDAFSNLPIIQDETPYIILGADKQSAVRSRFDAAHELGHVILHRNIKDNSLNNTNDFKIIEQQANRFSSAFLVPSNTFAQDFSLPTLNAFRTLKPKWLVSIGMLIMRSYDLGFISEDHYRKLWINYNQRGWRKDEPLDDKLPIERPLLLRRIFNLLTEQKVRTKEQIVAELPLSKNDIEELMYLPKGQLAVTLPSIEIRDDVEYQSAIEEVERIINGE